MTVLVGLKNAGVEVAVGVFEGVKLVGVRVGVSDGVSVAVRDGVLVRVGVAVRVFARVTVALGRWNGVCVAVLVAVGVCVSVIVPVDVGVAVGVVVGVFVGVGVTEGVRVTVATTRVTVPVGMKYFGVLLGVGVAAIAARAPSRTARPNRIQRVLFIFTPTRRLRRRPKIRVRSQAVCFRVFDRLDPAQR